jgi:alkylhydroperoxidase/carboxymuconolactone decarboxylase family protein YurZ
MGKLPDFYERFLDNFPEVGRTYNELSAACKTAGPLNERTAELIKIGVSIGGRLRGATRSHTRRARKAGASQEEIRHAVLMATTTIGFPGMMTGLAWVEEVFQEEEG